jgi:hypothetical protein
MTNVYMYRVPVKSHTRPSWIRFLELANAKYMWIPVENMFVCSTHFDSKYLCRDGMSAKLHKNGFPALLNGVCLPDMMVNILLELLYAVYKHRHFNLMSFQKSTE